MERESQTGFESVGASVRLELELDFRIILKGHLDKELAKLASEFQGFQSKFRDKERNQGFRYYQIEISPEFVPPCHQTIISVVILFEVKILFLQ